METAKKIATVVLGLLVVGILAFFALKKDTTETKLAARPKDDVGKPVFAAFRAYPDSDNDGFADWEELLHGTNLFDNRSIPIEKRGNTAPFATNEQATTEKGPARAAETPIVGKTEPPQSAIPQDPLREYGNAVAPLIAADATSLQKQTELFERVVKNADAETRGELKKLAENYKRTGVTIAAIAAPESAREIHSALANSFRDISGSILSLAVSENAAALSGNAWMEYSDAALAFGKTLQNLAYFFRDKKVQFKPTEPGFMFSLSSP